MEAKIQIPILLGTCFIAIAVGYRVLFSNRRKFRLFFLFGQLQLTGGIIVSGLLSPWLGVTLLLLWFVVAIFFYYQERKERALPPSNLSS